MALRKMGLPVWPFSMANPNRNEPTTGRVTFLFTDIEGSTRLWEEEPERMRPALARHDAISRAAVESHQGLVVKSTGDGVYAAFDEVLDALAAAIDLQLALADPVATNGILLRVRCGLHAGVAERRDNDYFGSPINRAARIMSAAHGGQVLLSQAVAALVGDRLPAGVALRDLGFVRLRDLASPEHIYQVQHPQLRQDFPALRSLAATPNNLPQLVSSFIGRERELSEVKNLLEKSRLLTLLGVGGLGKTRLSLQVAADTLDEFPDGVWFVELAPLDDERMVAPAVASVLGVKEEVGRTVADALVKHVRDRQLLIIMDNCEHLMQTCAELATKLLHAGTGLKILATSREHLRVAGEMSYQVPALAAPDPHRAITFADMTQYAAVRLFVERAGAAQPAFQMTEQNAPAVMEICRRLDGIPLAIELAAARARALSVDKIAERLTDRFRLLAHGDRTAQPRQQTLHALIDWSYDLLTDDERALFRRLAGFAGGWTLKAAEAIGAGGSLVEIDVVDVLTRLVEKSLVALDAGGTRYRFLETVREYAQERLNESGESDQVRNRHLHFYLALAEEAEPKLLGVEQGSWYVRLDLERENLLSAHRWCDRAAGGAQAGLRLVQALRLWLGRGLLEMGSRITIEALTRDGASEPTLGRCQGLFNAGRLSYFMGRYEEARSYGGESLQIAREIGDTSRVVDALGIMGGAALGQEDLATARQYLMEALALARGLVDKNRLIQSLTLLAELHSAEGDLDSADPLYEDAVVLAREVGDRDNTAINLCNLARTAIGRGSADRAKVMLRAAVAIVDEIGSAWGHQLLAVSAGLAAYRGWWECAARLYGAAEAQLRQRGIRLDPADESFLTPLIMQARKALGVTAFEAAEAVGLALSYQDAMAQAQESLATTH